MRLIFTLDARRDYVKWSIDDPAILARINLLLEECVRHPFTGTTGSTTTGVTAGIAQKPDLQSISKRLISTVGNEKHIDRYTFRIGLDGRAADNIEGA